MYKYEIKSNLGANLFFSLDEIVFQLKGEYDFTSNHKEVLKVIQDDNLLSFKDIIKKIELLRGVTITRGNIALYYEFMSKEEKIQNAFILDDIFEDREMKIVEYFLISANDLENEKREIKGDSIPQFGGTIKLHKLIFGQAIFGTIDTLQPINEYIEEIKASNEYKKFIKETLRKNYESGTVVITEDNIALYYEFMGDKDKKKNFEILNPLFYERISDIKRRLGTKISDFIQIENIDCLFTIGIIVFGIKDTLKSIDKYIHEIETSSEYKKFILLKKNKKSKSKAASNVLKLLDKGYSYKTALEDTLGIFDVSREDLELELDIYI